MGDLTNGLTNLDDIRGLKCMIDVIRNLLAVRLGSDRLPDRFFRHIRSSKKAGISLQDGTPVPSRPTPLMLLNASIANPAARGRLTARAAKRTGSGCENRSPVTRRVKSGFSDQYLAATGAPQLKR